MGGRIVFPSSSFFDSKQLPMNCQKNKDLANNNGVKLQELEDSISHLD